MVRASCLPFALTVLKIHILTASHQLAPASAANWFHKGRAMCYHVLVIMHVKDPQLSVIRVGHRVPLAGFCLSLCSLHVLNRDVNMIQTYISTDSICMQLCFQLVCNPVMTSWSNTNISKSNPPHTHNMLASCWPFPAAVVKDPPEHQRAYSRSCTKVHNDEMSIV